jgi:hypothetical protein
MPDTVLIRLVESGGGFLVFVLLAMGSITWINRNIVITLRTGLDQVVSRLDRLIERQERDNRELRTELLKVLELMMQHDARSAERHATIEAALRYTHMVAKPAPYTPDDPLGGNE